MIGPDITPLGEMKEEQQSYGNQLAATIALHPGEKFDNSHQAGKPIQLPADGKDKSVTGNIPRKFPFLLFLAKSFLSKYDLLLTYRYNQALTDTGK